MTSYFGKNTHPLILADFDYFRLPRERWELLLTRLRQMGATGLMLSVPWGFHEFEADRIDVSGATTGRRDLLGLLRLAATFELPCMLNLGPDLANGILNDGRPAWLSSAETDLLPAFSRWLAALSQHLVAQQWPAGPIIAGLVDNEATAGQTLRLSREVTEVRWPIWLRKHYTGIDALNAAYGSNYPTVSRVPFPENWGEASDPLARDAQQFLAEEKIERQTSLADLLTQAGWTVPLYPASTKPPVGAPSLRSVDLAGPLDLPRKAPKKTVLHLRRPVQADPEPVDVGPGLTWAADAPIRADGTLRPHFWRVRQALWSQGSVTEGLWTATTEQATLVTAAGDTLLKVETDAPPKTPVYRLTMQGDLVVDEALQVARKKLSGLYQAAVGPAQTDLIVLLADAAAPLPALVRPHLLLLLQGQAEALSRGATLAQQLSEMLTLADDQEEAAHLPAKRSVSGGTILEEARRGLSEADAALRKALGSIGGLERGFATMLDRDEPEGATLAPAPVAITPAAFEGEAQHTLLTVGARCGEVAPVLESAAAQLAQTVAQPPALTVATYQQSYKTAVTAAETALVLLLDLLAHLRLEIVAARLPLVTWRIHDQVQAVAETLRWGVLRS